MRAYSSILKNMLNKKVFLAITTVSFWSKSMNNYLRQGGNVFARLCLFVCLSVCLCVSKITQSYGRIFLKLSGNVLNGTNYQWFNFGGGILDSGSVWNFRYHCFQWGIRETAAKLKTGLPPSEQHCLGGGVRNLTAFKLIVNSGNVNC